MNHDHRDPLQPFLQDAVVTLAAPAQAWSRPDGSMHGAPADGGGAIDGVYVSDVRVVAGLEVMAGGTAGETISSVLDGAQGHTATALLRRLDLPDGARSVDADVRLELRRDTTPEGTAFRLRVASRLPEDLRLPLAVRLRPALDRMDAVKAGMPAAPVADVRVDGESASWSGDGVATTVTAPGARIALGGDELVLAWPLVVPSGGRAEVVFRVQAEDALAVVAAPGTASGWRTAAATVEALGVRDDRLARWIAAALDDLDALRLVRTGSADEFLAAGAPWFLTLFGRDSLWAARLMLPVDDGLRLAGGTLRTLAELQGTRVDPATAEQPGKIPHELRRASISGGQEGFQLPPLYYGTIDATALWISLLHDAWRAGMPESEVRALLPALEAALGWMRDSGDADGDGFLDYLDESGHGLANQGWKDSGDSIQWRDGRFAEGPIALCEVQAYAHAAALDGAELLDALGRPGADEWRDWAAALRTRFREAFWVSDDDGRYPAIALDARKQAVDSLTSNIGHLLGTGLLDAEEEALVAARLVSPALSSGFGLRTMSTSDSGYWPLSYHRGSVWAHDTAIAIHGLARSGFADEARELAEGLLAAAPAFGYRMPELHAGDPATETAAPLPYPASCRPQAWSAAAAIAVAEALSA